MCYRIPIEVGQKAEVQHVMSNALAVAYHPQTDITEILGVSELSDKSVQIWSMCRNKYGVRLSGCFPLTHELIPEEQLLSMHESIVQSWNAGALPANFFASPSYWPTIETTRNCNFTLVMGARGPARLRALPAASHARRA